MTPEQLAEAMEEAATMHSIEASDLDMIATNRETMGWHAAALLGRSHATKAREKAAALREGAKLLRAAPQLVGIDGIIANVVLTLPAEETA